MRIDGVALSERMIARENHDERLLCYQLVFKIGLLFPAEKSDIKSSALEVVCKRCGMVARNSDFHIEQFVAKDAFAFAVTKRYLRSPVVERIRANNRLLLPEWLDAWFSVSTRARIRGIVDGLGKR